MEHESNTEPAVGGGLLLATSLTALAGWVDGVGFLRLRGIFVSFMSGNSTIIGVSVATGAGKVALAAASMVFVFFSGVVIGELLTHRYGDRRPAVLLTVETVLLAMAAVIAWIDTPTTSEQIGLFAPLLALAMGMQNASTTRDGKVKTFVTGTLVQAGRAVASTFAGNHKPILPLLGLWGSLVVGAALGASVALRSNALALALASFFALLIGAWMSTFGRAR